MGDVEEIIQFLRLLKRGFDKDVFQCKLNELSEIVDSDGLDYDDFHTLFKLWLNLSIPITKWTSFGACIVPRDIVEERTIDYALRWLLANSENQGSFSRSAFLLDWLTGAMTMESIDIKALDSGYEIFYKLMLFEVLTPHALKLVYTLTKPSDVSRTRVVEIMNYAMKREGKKNMYRQLQVLLGLFKSYRPECVPESIPAIPIHTSFRKITPSLMARFQRCQENRNTTSAKRQHLMWFNPINSANGKTKAEPLVPNIEFSNIGSKQFADSQPQKNYLDFSDAISLLQHTLQQPMSRPLQLRALFCNEIGLTLLAIAPHTDQAFLSHDLLHILNACFLDSSSHSYAEKRVLLSRIAALQGTLMQGIPVVTRFLAQWLPLWNEKDFFAQILQLAEWISVDSTAHVASIVEPLMRVYVRAQPIEQCAILRTLVLMYCNLVYCSSRNRLHFECQTQNYQETLTPVAGAIADLCHKGLQIWPDDMRVLYSSISASLTMCISETKYGTRLNSVARLLPLALPVLAPSALLIDLVAALMIMYKKLFSKMKSRKSIMPDIDAELRKVLEAFSYDLVNCLCTERAFSNRKSGLIFERLHPQFVSKLLDLVPGADRTFSMRNSVAFLPYTYLEVIDPSDATNQMCFETGVKDSFPNLARFLMKVCPELR